VALLTVSLLLPEELCELLQVFPTSNNQKRIRQGEIRPSQGQRAHLVCLLIGKEHPLFAPGKALGQQGKGVATKRVKGMGDGKALLTIRVIRCS